MVVLLTIDVDPALLNADALPSTAARTEHNAPEIRIVDRVGNEVANDVLASVPGYQFYQPNDYRLDYLDFDQTFYVVSPKDVIVARPRDLADHIEWLLERQRYEEALHAAENAGDDYSVKGRLKVDDIIEIGQKYLHALVAQEKYEEAAALCPKILWQDLNLWQQWVFTFADHGHLAALAPHIPTIKPRLPPNVYETILEFALSNNASLYLDLVKRWPSSVFDVEREIASVEEKLGGHAQQIVLMEAAMELNGSAKHWDKYLAFALRLGIPNAVAVVSRHNLFHLLSDEIIQLLLEYDERLLDTDGEFAARIEQDLALEDGGPGLTRHDFPSLTTPVGRVRAAVFCPGVQLLVDAADKVQPSTVVTALKEFSGFLFIYLDALWRKERQRRDIRQDGAPYHTLLVELYAEYDPERLLAFLRSSGSYSVSKAYEICQDRDMVPEMVYLLGKMGDNKKALALIIERMADVAGAISFAKDQNDPALWEDLLTYSMDKPPFILGLLENMGSSALDPAAVVRRIPDDLAITGLKGAICHLFEDYGVQFYLQEGCEKIVQQDALALLESLLRQRSRGSLVEFRDITCSICSLPILQDLVGSTGQDGAIILFSCRHWFHSGCLLTRSGDASQDAYAAESREDLLFALRRRVGPVYGRTEQPFLVMETKEEPIPRLTSEIFRLRRRIMDLSLWCPICDDLEIGGRGSVGKLFKSEDEIRKAQ